MTVTAIGSSCHLGRGRRAYADFISYFRYLDNLRASGVTNMFGAAAYLEAEFGLPRDEASSILSKWMTTYDGSDDIDRRAAEAEALS